MDAPSRVEPDLPPTTDLGPGARELGNDLDDLHDLDVERVAQELVAGERVAPID